MNLYQNARLIIRGRGLPVKRVVVDGLRPIEAAQAAGASRSLPTCGCVAAGRQAGVGVSMDNFGTGSLSSLVYLKSLPISVLKFDCCLVQGLHQNSMGAEIAQIIISMVQGLNAWSWRKG